MGLTPQQGIWMQREAGRRTFGVVAGLALCWALAWSAPALAGDTSDTALERRVGYAYRLSDGELVYREIHEARIVGGELVSDRVTYVAPDGEVIARKWVDYTPSAIAPSFRLRVLDSGYIEGLKRNEEGAVVLYHREHAGAPIERARIDAPPNLVADAGFEQLIYRHFQDLLAGATLTFPFAVPSRLDTIEFSIRLIDRRRVLGEPALVFRMEPASFLLDWLAEPIDVAYHAKTHALLVYEGVSNIPRPNGEGNYRVRIVFPPEGQRPDEDERGDSRAASLPPG